MHQIEKKLHLQGQSGVELSWLFDELIHSVIFGQKSSLMELEISEFLAIHHWFSLIFWSVDEGGFPKWL